MHIFAEHHLLDISDALATNTQNFSRNVITERRREISRRGRKIFVLSERTLDQTTVPWQYVMATAILVGLTLAPTGVWANFAATGGGGYPPPPEIS